jgi:hypothetical protein
VIGAAVKARRRLRSSVQEIKRGFVVRRLLARANSQAPKRRLFQADSKTHSRAGYDELSCPWYLGVMAVAILVLVVDVRDAWPEVLALASQLING